MANDAAGMDLMNRIYRHERFIYNVTRKYYLLGRDRRDPASQDLELGA